MKKKTLKNITSAVVIVLCLLYVAKFGGPNLLKFYISRGIGDCKRNPIFCMAPDSKVITARIDREYLTQLIPYKFPRMSISIPRGFSVVQETIRKPYYKRNKDIFGANIVYLLHEEKDFFINLYPQVKKKGINDNYEFIKHIMGARLDGVKDIGDAFFVVMKGIFTPDLGNQNKAEMFQVRVANMKGFVNYGRDNNFNYFDCNMIDPEGGFFKVYIKDKGAKRSLEDVLTIISTLKSIS